MRCIQGKYEGVVGRRLGVICGFRGIVAGKPRGRFRGIRQIGVEVEGGAGAGEARERIRSK